jgi:nitrite reductase/ring-hydroxylating ferredoxin subunit
VLGLAGTGVLAAGGFLGGHLSFAQGVGPNQTVFDPGSDEWTPARDVDELPEGEPVSAVAGDTPVMLLRRGDRIHALHDRCSHRGCPLSGGEIDGDVVECTCHGSRFSLEDGSVLRGPATAPQPAFDVREAGGGFEVRRRSP